MVVLVVIRLIMWISYHEVKLRTKLRTNSASATRLHQELQGVVLHREVFSESER